MKKLKIRPTILFILTTLALITIVISLTLQYYSSKQLALQATRISSKHISDKLQLIVKNTSESNLNLLSLLETSSSIHEAPKAGIQHEILRKFTVSLSNRNYMYAIYIGYDNGNFYEVINLENDSELRKKFNASKNHRWLVLKVLKENGKRIEIREYLDVNLILQKTTKRQTNYNPTLRPWYKQAIKSMNIIRTKPYLFSNLKSMGMTGAKKVLNSNNVIAYDISLKSISKFLKDQEVVKGSQLYLFDKNGLIISSNIQEAYYPKNINNILKSSISKSSTSLHINNKNYISSNITLTFTDGFNAYLSTIIPEYEMLKPYNEKIFTSLFINFLVLMVLLPIIWIATKFIVKPIDDLKSENKKIKNRNYETVALIDTPIRELHDLSKSLLDMSVSIKQHEESQIKLMDSVIKLIAGAIDAKSPYTGGHCNRVPILSIMLAKKASNENSGIFKDFKLKNKDETRELNIAAWLHDCGKVTTPEYVVDKSTKLETLYNRIHEIRTRFEVIYRDLIIESYKKLENNEDKKSVESWLQNEHKKLEEDFNHIAKANKGGEFMSEEDKQKITTISKRIWERHFDNTIGLSREEFSRVDKNSSNIESLLSDKNEHIIKRTNFSQQDYDKYNFKMDVPKNLYNLGEIYNLTIGKGTLTPEERFKINEHIIMSIKMLEELPFPDYLKKVPEYAGAHHETLIGTGYPRKLKKEDMSIPARIIAVADIFEALTASDRPYKDAKTLSETIKILSFMAKDQHIDEDIFKLFLSSGVYLEYAQQYLEPEQIDNVDIDKYL